jgi:hypothetical protein
MDDFSPYTREERQTMRRLLLASGNDIDAWCKRLRRSADFLQSLSPAQAGIVAEQAQAIAADPEDYGGDEVLETARRELAAIDESERGTYVWREIVAVRRRHYPELPETD